MKNTFTIGKIIPTYCLKIGNEYIPFWKLKYLPNENNSDDGYYKRDDPSIKTVYSELQKCLYDINSDKIIFSDEFNIFPDTSKLEFAIDEKVLVECKGSKFKIDYIENYKFENYHSSIGTISELREYYFFETSELKSIGVDITKISTDDIIEIRDYQVTYILKSGQEVNKNKLHKLIE